MATVVVAHGAWSGAWAWKRMRPLMAAAGHDLRVPAQTGIGARAHLTGPGVCLDTHIADVAGLLETEELTDVVLVGHSYGGMVATGVAARCPDRVSRLVYVDAFVPRDGACLFDFLPAEDRAAKERAAREAGQGFLVPPNPLPPDTDPADAAWIARHRSWQPIGCLSQPIRLGAEPGCPRHYVRALRHPPADLFGPFAARARSAPGWTCEDIDASHSPNVTAPAALAAILDRLAADRGPALHLG